MFQIVPQAWVQRRVCDTFQCVVFAPCRASFRASSLGVCDALVGACVRAVIASEVYWSACVQVQSRRNTLMAPISIMSIVYTKSGLRTCATSSRHLAPPRHSQSLGRPTHAKSRVCITYTPTHTGAGEHLQDVFLRGLTRRVGAPPLGRACRGRAQLTLPSRELDDASEQLAYAKQ